MVLFQVRDKLTELWMQIARLVSLWLIGSLLMIQYPRMFYSTLRLDLDRPNI